MSELRRQARHLAPAVLVVAIAIGWLVPSPLGLEFASRPATEDPAAEFAAALDALPARPTVLVGFDPDLGTYAEVRATVRTVLADLLRRDGRIVVVSLTPEGRALAIAERSRFERLEVNPARLLDLGFVPGAEAALVRLARDPEVPSDQDGALARAIADDGLAAVDAVLVVGGNDIGPRSWIEQVRPRLEDAPPFLAVAPTVLLPELLPYLGDGSLTAALATPRDGAAFRDRTSLDRLDRLVAGDGVPPASVLVGLVAAIILLGTAWVGRVAASARGMAGDGRA